ncbi:ester cyclase [Salinibacterium sp. ZJ454]|uniref:ester cyclase n=1 Tax=Salinibacterium sp. ZJ454 TaxID=2708339 RepID=UPI00141EB292|nr:ester cyclase [Salinibacterium sp. ZJ454]
MNDPKALAKRFYDMMSDWSPNKLDEICSPTLRGHAGAGADLDELKQSITGFVDAFSNFQATVKYLVREDDLVSAWVTYEGTHTGTFAGVPGSGRPIKIAGWDMLRVENDRIVEITQYCDVFTLMNQIGALPTAAPA